MNMLGHFMQVTAPFGAVLFYLFFHLVTGLSISWRMKRDMPLLWRHFLADGHALERRLNRPERGAAALRLRGIVVFIVLSGIGILLGAGADLLAQRHVYGFLFSLLLLASGISVMPRLRQMQSLVAGKDAAVFRHTIEDAALEMNEYLVAPVVFYGVAGAKGMLFYVASAALNRAFGHHGPFGGFVRQISGFANFVPARLSALLFVVAALFVSNGSPRRAARTIAAQAGNHPDRNVGWILAAVAGALGITLAGPSRHYEESVPWLGPEKTTAKVVSGDLSRARLLFFVFFICVIFLVLTGLVLYLNFT